MSNPTDPRPTSPDQPDPTKPEELKGDKNEPGVGGSYMTRSSFDFELPEGASELPPVPQPNVNETETHQAVVPPRPTATRPASNTFDFINMGTGSQGSMFDIGLDPVPVAPPPPAEPPLLTPTDSIVNLPPERTPPDLPAPPVVPEPSSSGEIGFDLPMPTGDPAEHTLGVEMLDVGAFPELAQLESTPNASSVPDIGSLFPPPEVPTADPGSFVTGEPAIAELELPLVEPASDVPISVSVPDVPMAEDGWSVSDQDLPLAEPTSDTTPQPPTRTTTPTPDLESVLGPLEPTSVTDAVSPVSGWLDESGIASATKPAEAEPIAEVVEVADAEPVEVGTPVEEAPGVSSRSSFEFDLSSSGELPNVPQPEGEDTTGPAGALPPPPDITRTPSKTFHFGGTEGEATSKFDIGLEATPIVPIPTAEPLPTATDAASNIPTATPTPGHDSDAAVGDLELIDLVNPVAPASGWLDSGILPTPSAEPVAEEIDAFETPPASPVESSDIFSGARTPTASQVEHSDVIAATAYSPATPADINPPAEPVRLSDIALTFDGPPGGSTLQDSGGSDLPIADEVSGGTSVLDAADDDESIHDMPDPLAADPLFDSAKLAEAPDLPAFPAPTARDDSPEYGRTPEYSTDASSILADLSDLGANKTSADSSSVSVESPGVERTLTGNAADGAFDLTVPDEPIPAGLFEEMPDETSTESIDWESQSGSDLFAEGRAAPEIDLEADRVAPVDIDLSSDQPSLSSAPSSIFSENKPSSGSGSADVRIGKPEPISDHVDFSEVEDAEFSDHPALSDTAERPTKESPKPPAQRSHGLSSSDFELPSKATSPAKAPDEEAGAIDWDAAALSDDENATRGIPKDASLSDILRGLSDDSAEISTRDLKPVVGGGDDTNTPMVTVDWMASSAEEAALEVEPKPAPKPKAKERKEPAKEKAKGPEPKANPLLSQTGTGTTERAEPARKVEKPKRQPGKGGGIAVGLVAGVLLAGGAFAGLYFGDVIPNSEKVAQVGPQGGTPPQGGQPNPAGPPGSNRAGPAPSAPDAKAAFAAGDIAKALELVKSQPAATPDDKATAGRVRVYSKVQEVGTDDDLKQGRADLQAVINDPEAAKTPEGTKRAVRATVDLGISYEAAGDTEAARKLFTEAKAKYPAHAAVFDALLDRLDAPTAGGGTSFFTPRLTPADAEKVLLAVGGLLLADEPAKTDDPEPGLYYWKAVKLAGTGKYTEAIDLIGKAKAAHIKRAKALAGRGINPLTDPLEQMFPRACDELAAYWKLRSELYSNPAIADAIKSNGLAKTLDSLAKAEKDLTTTKAELAKTEKDLTTTKTDLKTAKEKVATLETDVGKLDKDLKAAEKAKLDTEDKLKTAEKDAKEKGELLTAVATALKPAVTLPEKWEPADLVAGVKTAAARATGPDLKALVPNAMTAIGGGGLSAGQLIEIADRMAKAEATAKIATDKLASETKKLNDKYDTDTKKLKTDHAEELKKLADNYAIDIKKLKETNTEETKKLLDKFAIDTKKLNDEHADAIKAEQAKTEAEKAKAALREITFQKQLANAVTPTQALDIWLPVLTDLRRASDADPAMAIAARVLASSPEDSDDVAKAHTVNGMGYLLKGDYTHARDEFQFARRSPAYKADKPWAKVADAGLEAVSDPLAPYRQPVVLPPVDLKVAAKSLDTGITAFKEGKYEAAVTALTDAAKHDPADPLAWYFLGASRWAMGNEEQAKKDFAQAALREKVWPQPARIVSEALTPIQGDVRDALDRARP